ncbi:MAG: ATP-grasp domain-containing protein [Micromonosporaceae bacterium]
MLLLGADLYVLRACESRDIEPVMLCDHRAYDTGRVSAPPGGTLLLVDDVTSLEACLGALHRAGLADKQFDGVQTTWEYAVVTAAALGGALGCRSIDPTTAVFFRDKSLQKRRLREAGIPVTRTVVVEDICDVSEVPLEFEQAVLKPVAGGGTTSTSVVRGRKDLEAISRQEHAAGRTFLLEEFVEGEEWMAEGVVFDGEVLFYGMGVYTQPCLTALTDQVPISLRRLDPTHDAEAYAGADPIVRGAIAALGLQDGVFHMELFREQGTGRVVFSECAARRGGALTQEQVFAKFNVDLAEAAVLCAVGQRPQIDVKVNRNVVGCAGLYGPAGTVVSYPTSDEIMAQPNVKYAQMWVPLGASLNSKFSASADMLGAALLVTASVEEFDERVVALREWFSERLAVAEAGLTPKQRRAWQQKHWPERRYRDWLYDGT